ncbi:hypothetical protein R1flu_025225 [Riccia fluitans]|uniref:Uncharacterized protein n=1 Tax=Riccia fluitans TaxID=41844 RepID=A0ABD1XY20_9MARC
MSTGGNRKHGLPTCGGKFTKASLGGYVMKDFSSCIGEIEHFHHKLAFDHYTWVAITNPTAPTPDWRDAVKKTVMRQVKALGVCNESTCLGPYLVHLYHHFHEMKNEQREEPKKWKALEKPVPDSKTKRKKKRRRKQRGSPLMQHGSEKQAGASCLTRG